MRPSLILVALAALFSALFVAVTALSLPDQQGTRPAPIPAPVYRHPIEPDRPDPRPTPISTPLRPIEVTP